MVSQVFAVVIWQQTLFREHCLYSGTDKKQQLNCSRLTGKVIGFATKGYRKAVSNTGPKEMDLRPPFWRQSCQSCFKTEIYPHDLIGIIYPRSRIFVQLRAALFLVRLVR